MFGWNVVHTFFTLEPDKYNLYDEVFDGLFKYG